MASPAQSMRGKHLHDSNSEFAGQAASENTGGLWVGVQALVELTR